MLKNIFARIWALWAIVIFLATLLLFYIPFLFCFFFNEPKRSRYSYPIYKNWMRIFLPLIGVRVKTKGLEYFESGKQYIVICNHRSMMDIPVSTTKLPGANKTIAKIEMSRVPVFGIIYKLGSVLVDRKNKESRSKSYSRMKEVLAMGLHMTIYPEGTRNKSSEILTPFHDGAFNLAIDTKTSIMPAIIMGTEKIMPNNKKAYLLPGTIIFQMLKPIEPSEDPQALKQKCYELMKANLK